jgi:hypothetical protein
MLTKKSVLELLDHVADDGKVCVKRIGTRDLASAPTVGKRTLARDLNGTLPVVGRASVRIAEVIDHRRKRFPAVVNLTETRGVCVADTQQTRIVGTLAHFAVTSLAHSAMLCEPRQTSVAIAEQTRCPSGGTNEP